LVQIADPRLLPAPWREVFLAVAVASIAATPLLYARGLRARRYLADAGDIAAPPDKRRRADHAIVVGFGPAGQAVGRALRALRVPFTVIELNAATVKAHRDNGIDILIGDSRRAPVLRAAGAGSARVLVLAINDAEATRATATAVRSMAPDLRIVARANYLGEVEPLLRAGVNEVVAQEMETAVELMARTLRHFLVPDDEISQRVALIRDSVPGQRRAAPELGLDALAVSSVVAGIEVRIAAVPAGSEADGVSLAALDLRRRTGVHVIAWKRADRLWTDIDPERALQAGDILVLLGPASHMTDATDVLRNVRTDRTDTGAL
jgi:CPA2 family monovalent cation:H+ antiporter-2